MFIIGLDHGYDFIINIKSNYYRDDPDNFGRFYYGNLEIQANTLKYHCVIDVDFKNMPDDI
jgi:hypothetical protein